MSIQWQMVHTKPVRIVQLKNNSHHLSVFADFQARWEEETVWGVEIIKVLWFGLRRLHERTVKNFPSNRICVQHNIDASCKSITVVGVRIHRLHVAQTHRESRSQSHGRIYINIKKKKTDERKAFLIRWNALISEKPQAKTRPQFVTVSFMCIFTRILTSH